MTGIYVFMITVMVMAIVIFGGVLSILLTAAFFSDKVDRDEVFSQGSWDNEILHLNHLTPPTEEPKS